MAAGPEALPGRRAGDGRCLVERARAVTVRRLVDEVEWAVETRAAGGAAPVAPPTLGARLAVDQRQMRAHARRNRITGCGHHLRGIHQGRVRAWGTAPEDVTWELGVRPGRAPLLRSMAMCTWERASVGYRPFHTGFRFSANARGPSTTSSLVQSFRTRG